MAAGRRARPFDRFVENAIELDVDALCDGDRRLHRRRHATRRGGRRSLGRLLVRPPGPVADSCRRARGRARRAAPRARARRRRASQRAARDRRLERLRSRGQPARLPDRSIREQGDRINLVDAACRLAAGATLAELHLPRSAARRRSASRRPCSRSRASREPIPCSGPRCARRVRSWPALPTFRPPSPRPSGRQAGRCRRAVRRSSRFATPTSPAACPSPPHSRGSGSTGRDGGNGADAPSRRARDRRGCEGRRRRDEERRSST